MGHRPRPRRARSAFTSHFRLRDAAKRRSLYGSNSNICADSTAQYLDWSALQALSIPIHKAHLLWPEYLGCGGACLLARRKAWKLEGAFLEVFGAGWKLRRWSNWAFLGRVPS
jgi:hypothetical protein